MKKAFFIFATFLSLCSLSQEVTISETVFIMEVIEHRFNTLTKEIFLYSPYKKLSIFIIPNKNTDECILEIHDENNNLIHKTSENKFCHYYAIYGGNQFIGIKENVRHKDQAHITYIKTDTLEKKEILCNYRCHMLTKKLNWNSPKTDLPWDAN